MSIIMLFRLMVHTEDALLLQKIPGLQEDLSCLSRMH